MSSNVGKIHKIILGEFVAPNRRSKGSVDL